MAAPAADLQEAAGFVRDVLGQLRPEEPEDPGAVAAGMLAGPEVLDRPYLYVLGLADVYIECGRVMDGVHLKRKMKDMKFDR